MHQRDEYAQELLSAYLDHELSPDECTAVEQMLARDEDLRQWFDDMRAVADDMALLPRFQLDADLAARVVAQAAAQRNLDPGQAEVDAADRIQTRGSSPRRAPAWWHRRAALGWATVAACLTLALFLVVQRTGVAPLSASRPVAVVPDAAHRMDRDQMETTASDHQESSRRPRDGEQAGPAVAQPSRQTAAVASGSNEGEAAAAPSQTLGTPQVRGSDLAGTPVPEPAPDERGTAAGQGGEKPAADHTPVAARSAPGVEPGREEDRHPKEDWTAKVPTSSSLQLLLVIDITLTPQGQQQSALECTLARQGVALEETATVDAALEESLLATRFFDPRDPLEKPERDAALPTRLTLVYVRARGRQVDDIWRALQSQPALCSSVALDVAILPADLAMFQDLRRTCQPLKRGAAAGADDTRQQRRAIAHRLALSPEWRGTPAHKLQGLQGLAGLMPDWMLGDPSAPATRKAGQPEQSARQPSAASGGDESERMDEKLEVEALFVVH